MGLDTLLSYMQPRVMDDVRSFLAAVPDTESFEAVQYAGMHVRDVPPRMFGTFKATETLVRERERERERERVDRRRGCVHGDGLLRYMIARPLFL